MLQQIVMNPLFFTALFLMGFGGTGYVVEAQTAEKAASSTSFSIKERIEIFEDVWRKVNDKFYDPTFNGVDWNAVRERYRPHVEKANGHEEFYDLIDEMLAELRTSHTGFTRPSYPGKKSYSKDVGLSVYEVEGQVVISWVKPGSEAAKSGVTPGMVVRTVKGKPVEEYSGWLRGLIKQRASLATERHLQLILYDNFFFGDSSTPVTVGLEDASGKSFAVALTPRKSLNEPTLEAHRLASGYGYVKFNMWIPPNDKRFEEELKKLMDTPGLIIDLRGNTGGQDDPTMNITSMFFAPGTYWGAFVFRGGKKQSLFTRKVDLHYKGPIVVLVDEGSVSAAENFTALVQESGRGIVIGQSTCGCLLGTGYEKVRGGGTIAYPNKGVISSKGRKIEGVGVIPDKVVPVALSDLRNYRDAVLEEAERTLRSSSPMQNHKD